MIQEIHRGTNAVSAPTRKVWRNWLAKNHDKETSVWLIIFHKKSATASVYYDEAVEEALCFGWVDSVSNSRNEESSYLYFAKRKNKSNWSKANKERAEDGRSCQTNGHLDRIGSGRSTHYPASYAEAV
jgi:uncharacterized protein YdeI (YjbR/CyaY-like superfamily)